MTSQPNASRPLYRIWIASYQDWQPVDWRDVPSRAIAVEPAESEALSAAEARSFLEGFNRRIMTEHRRLWALAVPVTVRYDGDAQPGGMIVGRLP